MVVLFVARKREKKKKQKRRRRRKKKKKKKMSILRFMCMYGTMDKGVDVEFFFFSFSHLTSYLLTTLKKFS